MSKVVERLVVAGAAGVFVVGTGVGLNLALSSPEPVADEPTCEIKRVEAGAKLTSNLVMVHVYNTSQRAGLATRVKINLERRNFLGGVAENNPGQLKAKNVSILTTDPDDPRVKLVAAQFKGKVQRVAPDFELEDGISILVGPDYAGMKKGARTQIKAGRAIEVCLPTIDLS